MTIKSREESYYRVCDVRDVRVAYVCTYARARSSSTFYVYSLCILSRGVLLLSLSLEE